MPGRALLALLIVLVAGVAPARAAAAFPPPGVAVLRAPYTAWNGERRGMIVALPSAALATDFRPRLPLVIALHGAAGRARCDTWFGKAPLRGSFAVACLDGQGAGTRGYSYGAPGQIADQLRVPELVRAWLPKAAIDYRHIVLVGQSMGGLEALLAADAAPQRWSAVVALDAPTDLAAHYANVGPASSKSKAMRRECGGSPQQEPTCYRLRSPVDRMTRLGASGTPVVLWWSSRDPIAGSPAQAPTYARTFRHRFPGHPLALRVGRWNHGRAWWEDGYAWLEQAFRMAGIHR